MTSESMDKLLAMGVQLSAEKVFSRLLESILLSSMGLIRCDGGVLYLREDALVFKVMRNNSKKGFPDGEGGQIKLPPISLNENNACIAALLAGRCIRIDDVNGCCEYDFTGASRYEVKSPANCTAYPAECIFLTRCGSTVIIPLKNQDNMVIGILQLMKTADAPGENAVFPDAGENAALPDAGEHTAFPDDDVHMLNFAASQAAVAIQNMRYVKETKGLLYSLVQVLSTAIDERTPYNATHTRNMVRCGDRFIDYLNTRSRAAGEAPVFSPMHKDEFLMSVWLHDIGKLVTPLQVMNKASRLKPEELAEMKHRFQNMRYECRIAYLEGRMDASANALERKRIDEAEELVERVNLVGDLPDNIAELIRQTGSRRYRAADGTEKAWFTENELEKLLIRKGTLTDAERLIMENHVVITERLLAQIKFTKDYEHVPLWASSHHEFLNGTGYPGHLHGDEIPFEVRILTILDIFDALTADDRPYKPGMPVEEALSILMAMAATEGKLDLSLTEQFAESGCWEL